MTGEAEHARDLLEDRLEIYGQIQAILKDVLANKQGSQWGVDQLKAVKDRFSILEGMDAKEGKIRIYRDKFVRDKALTELIDELKRTMLSVRHLLSMLQIRLEGGKQIISSRLTKVLEGKRIKGYKNRGKLFSESNTFIC